VSRSSIGRKGEDQAVQFLIDKGFKVIERNYHSRVGEVDIIAIDNDVLVFIEVKAWSSYGLEQLERGINARKQKRIIETAKYFLSIHREYMSMAMRFDVIFIGTGGINHISSAFTEDIS
jgi:putative endonuclease